jgi:hypothetical protein
MDVGGVTTIGPTMKSDSGGGSGVARLAYRDVQTGDPAGPYGTGTVGSNLQTTLIEVSGLPAGGPLNTVSGKALDQTGTTVTDSITPSGGVDAFLFGGFGSFLDARFGGTPSFTPNGDTTMLSNLVANTGMWGVGQAFYGESSGGAVTLGGTQGGTTNGSYRYGIVLSAFATDGEPFNWIDAPFSVDGDDVTYEYVFDDTITATTGPFWRGTLADAYLIASISADIGFEDAGSATVLVQAGNEADYSDAATIDTITLTATGSYTSDSVSASWTPTAVYRYWQLVLDSAAQGVHVHEVHLYDPPDGGGVTDHGALAGLADDDHPQYVLTTEGGLDKVFPHGAMGSTEALDPTDGNVHTGTLDDDCTLTLAAPPTTRDGDPAASTIELWITQDGSGGHALTLAATGGSVVGDISGHTTTAGEMFRVIAERIPGTTNDWVVNLVGGGGAGSIAIDDGSTTVDPAEAITFAGVGIATVEVTDDGGGAATVTVNVALTDEAVQAVGHYELLMTGSSPPEPLEDGTGEDWLYVWVNG